MPEVPFLGWPRPLHPRTHPLSLPIPSEVTEPSPQRAQRTQRKHMKTQTLCFSLPLCSLCPLW
jgi:hypothetical protein